MKKVITLAVFVVVEPIDFRFVSYRDTLAPCLTIGKSPILIPLVGLVHPANGADVIFEKSVTPSDIAGVALTGVVGAPLVNSAGGALCAVGVVLPDFLAPVSPFFIIVKLFFFGFDNE